MKKILVTGTAGFIGYHLAKKLLENDFDVFGIDSINDYYDINLKYARLENTGISGSNRSKNNEHKGSNSDRIKFGTEITSTKYSNYRFMRLDISNKRKIFKLFEKEKFDYVVHLAAQAGVRYSIENPDIYIQSNIIGFFNIIEACRQFTVDKLLYASSSSVYGNNIKIPFSTEDKTDAPVSLYAATKKSNELIAHAYSNLYQISTIGLRFFTVYGSWGRPDMSPIIFADAILQGKPLTVFNGGEMERDYTHISDITEGILKLIQTHSSDNKKYQVFNLGNGNPVNLLEFIITLEKYLGKKAILKFSPMQPGDVKKTWADTNALAAYCDFRPKISVDQGIREFTEWYTNYTLSV